MPFIEEQKGWFRLVVKYQGRKFAKALQTQSKKEAEELRARADENLRLLRRGRISYTAGDDLITLLLSDGRINAAPAVERQLTLGEFFDQFNQNRPPGKESNTAYTENIHVAHLRRLLEDKTPLSKIPDRLQDYVNFRGKEAVSQVTIKKELGTLSSIWNKWGKKFVPLPLSLRGLAYDKQREKPPFQTWEQIQKQTKDPKSNLWDSLYLTLSEIGELLAFIQKTAINPFLHPMFCMATHTGARRSEMIRSQVHDFDLAGGIVKLREKKKDRTKRETYRHVPMTGLLKKVMKNWLANHPGGTVTFCREPGKELTPQLANHHLRWALDDSKWKVVKGWHCFRHSFISNLASSGVDERIIMRLAGHLNPETTRRYQHLFPSTVQASMDLVFGKR